MSKDLNRWEGIGRLGKDPDVRYSTQGKAIANFTIACSDDYFDKKSNSWIERTNWVRLVAFDMLAERVGKKLKKGSQIYVSGKLTERKWQDQNGQDRYTTEIVANQMQMLGKNNESPVGTPSNGGQQVSSPSSTPANAGSGDFDDDIPF